MRFGDIAGNDAVLKALRGMVDSGRIPHAIMLSEQDGGGAMPLAVAFLQYLYCRSRAQGDSCGVCPSCNKISKLIHPDVHVVFPTTTPDTSAMHMGEFRALYGTDPCFTEADLNEALGTEGKSAMISVAESREILSTLSMSALEGGYRSMLVYLPEKMNQEAANRLLKAIEEPEEKTQFILVTHAPEKVLQTISSRCQHIHVMPSGSVRGVEFQDPQLLSDLMEALLSHNLLGALEVGDRLAALPSRENAKAFCKFAGDALRNMFFIRQGMASLAAATEEQVSWAGRCKPTFPRAAAAYFDRALMLIGRNVNLKLVFTDLIDRLSAII